MKLTWDVNNKTFESSVKTGELNSNKLELNHTFNKVLSTMTIDQDDNKFPPKCTTFNLSNIQTNQTIATFDLDLSVFTNIMK